MLDAVSAFCSALLCLSTAFNADRRPESPIPESSISGESLCVQEKKVAIAPVPHPAKKMKAVRLCTYYGEVLAIDSRGINIKGAEDNSPRFINPNAEIVIRRFLIGDYLAKGEQDPRESSTNAYRWSDVMLGDKVEIVIHHRGDDDLCARIIIHRRPGGLVPPAPWDDSTKKYMFHEAANAWQAFEDRGIPLPPEIDPVVQDRKFRAQREESLRQQKEISEFRARIKFKQEHTAPRPREVRR